MFLSRIVFRRTTQQFRAFSSKESGTVKWFDVKKGFGFIAPQDGGKDVFVHQTVIHADGFRSLAEGETVEYTVQHDPSGRLKATLVTGPMGAFVQGAPKPSFSRSYDDFGFNAPKTSNRNDDDDDDDDNWMNETSSASPADMNDYSDEQKSEKDKY